MRAGLESVEQASSSINRCSGLPWGGVDEDPWEDPCDEPCEEACESFDASLIKRRVGGPELLYCKEVSEWKFFWGIIWKSQIFDCLESSGINLVSSAWQQEWVGQHNTHFWTSKWNVSILWLWSDHTRPYILSIVPQRRLCRLRLHVRPRADFETYTQLLVPLKIVVLVECVQITLWLLLLELIQIEHSKLFRANVLLKQQQTLMNNVSTTDVIGNISDIPCRDNYRYKPLITEKLRLICL